MEKIINLEEQSDANTVEMDLGVLQRLLRDSRDATKHKMEFIFDENENGRSVTITPTEEGGRVNDYLDTLSEDN